MTGSEPRRRPGAQPGRSMRRRNGRFEAVELTPCCVEGCGAPAYGSDVYHRPNDGFGDCLVHALKRLWPAERARMIEAGANPEKLPEER